MSPDVELVAPKRHGQSTGADAAHAVLVAALVAQDPLAQSLALGTFAGPRAAAGFASWVLGRAGLDAGGAIRIIFDVDPRDWRIGYVDAAGIHLPRNATRLLLVHELSHFAAGAPYDFDHGPDFTARHLGLVEIAFGAAVARQLAAAYRAHGVVVGRQR